jgi:Ca2+-binding EF-hand superfamily protein
MADAWWNVASLAAVGVGTYFFLRNTSSTSRSLNSGPVPSTPAPAEKPHVSPVPVVAIGAGSVIRMSTPVAISPFEPTSRAPSPSNATPVQVDTLPLARLETLYARLQSTTDNEFEYREQLEGLFTELDHDHDGYLTDGQANQFWQVVGLDHVTAIVHHMGVGRLCLAQHPVLLELFALLDKDGDGELSSHEFAPLVAALEYPDHPPDAVQLTPEQLGPDAFANRVLTIVDRVPLSELLPIVTEYMLAHDI